MSNKTKVFLVIATILIIAIMIFRWYINIYNKTVTLQENNKKTWADVEATYQRRADLIPNLVATVKGYAKHEKSTLTEVMNARAKATSVTVDPSKLSAASLSQFQAAQSGLTSALSKLMVVVERYPNLKANENFRDLQSQLEGTENRINVARQRYNGAVRKYNTHIRGYIQQRVLAKYADEFPKAEPFKAEETAKTAPKVSF
jgi:LemA protein